MVIVAGLDPHTEVVAPPRSRAPLLVLALVALIVVAVGLRLAGVPAGPLVVATSGIGAFLVLRIMSDRRFAGAERQDPGALDGFRVQLSAERYAVGRLMQVRLFPPTSRVWAPGVLAVGSGEVRFMPSSAKRADRAWSGRPTAVEVHKIARASVVRVHTAGDSAQFVVQQPADAVRAQLTPLLPVGT